MILYNAKDNAEKYYEEFKNKLEKYENDIKDKKNHIKLE